MFEKRETSKGDFWICFILLINTKTATSARFDRFRISYKSRDTYAYYAVEFNTLYTSQCNDFSKVLPKVTFEITVTTEEYARKNMSSEK